MNPAGVVRIILTFVSFTTLSRAFRPLPPQAALASWADSAVDEDDVTNPIGFEAGPVSLKRSEHPKSSLQTHDVTRRSGGLTHRISKHQTFCSCQQKNEWIDFGPDWFPRYVRVVTCATDQRTCCAECRPRNYSLPILKNRRDPPLEFPLSVGEHGQSGTRIPKEDYGYLIPEPLLGDWEVEYHSISVACECTCSMKSLDCIFGRRDE